MKHYTNIAIILGCLIALFGFERQAYTETCSDDAGAAIARAYAIAVSDPEGLTLALIWSFPLASILSSHRRETSSA